MFINNIIWHFTGGKPIHNTIQKRYNNILLYGYNCVINNIYIPYKYYDKRNKNYNRGKYIEDVWDDIAVAQQLHEAKLYPTKKPSKLLERIICLSTI